MSSGLKNELKKYSAKNWGVRGKESSSGKCSRSYLLGRKRAKIAMSLEPMDERLYKRMVNAIQ